MFKKFLCKLFGITPIDEELVSIGMEFFRRGEFFLALRMFENAKKYNPKSDKIHALVLLSIERVKEQTANAKVA